MQIGPKLRLGGSVGRALGKVQKPLMIGGALALTGGLAGIGPLAGLAGKAGLLGKLGTAGKFLKDHKKDIVDYGELGEGVYDRVQENKAAGQMNDRYRSLQPYRDMALQQLQAPTPSTAGLFTEPQGAPPRYRAIGSRGGY